MTSLRLSFLLVFFLSATAFSQKNVTDVTKSELTGISLPVGSKQDKRILMTASEEALLEMKAKEIGRECSGSTEVVFLSLDKNGKQSDLVKKAFISAGYNKFAVALSDLTGTWIGGDNSKHSGASGMGGAMNTYSQEYKGKATVSNWEIILPNRWKDKTDTFEAWLEAVQGGRILRLVDKQAIGIKYALVKKIK